MKHRKLLIGTSIGCAVLLAGAALYLGCAATSSTYRPTATYSGARSVAIVEPQQDLEISQGDSFQVGWAGTRGDGKTRIGVNLVEIDGLFAVPVIHGVTKAGTSTGKVDIITERVPVGTYYVHLTIADGVTPPVGLFAKDAKTGQRLQATIASAGMGGYSDSATPGTTHTLSSTAIANLLPDGGTNILFISDAARTRRPVGFNSLRTGENITIATDDASNSLIIHGLVGVDNTILESSLVALDSPDIATANVAGSFAGATGNDLETLDSSGLESFLVYENISRLAFSTDAPSISVSSGGGGRFNRWEFAKRGRRPAPASAQKLRNAPPGEVAQALEQYANRSAGAGLQVGPTDESAVQELMARLSTADEVWIIEKTAFPAAAKSDAGPGCGALLARLLEQTETVPVPLKHTDVQARISGHIATVEVTQEFHNPFSEKIEAVYVFPLPQNSAVNEFLMTIGERTIRGIIREREEAQRIYAAARRQGHVASLLTQERPNIFTQKVANIEPGKEIDINIKYFNTLAYVDGSYEFVFPMVVGPRFNPPGMTDGVGAVARGKNGISGQSTEVQYLAPHERSGHDISLSVEIDAGVTIEDIKSPTHAIDVSHDKATYALVELSELDSIPNKDFVLRYKVAGDAVKSTLLTHRDERGGFFTLMLFPPHDLSALRRQPTEMIFVLDCSGSMSGAPIAKAKAAMERALKRLQPDDTFQIIRFSNDASQLGPVPLPATAENVERGLDYVRSLRGTGGTMMVEGIKAALDFPHDRERLRLVSFMTDGFIGNEAQIFGEIYQRLGDARIFSFGVGTSVNRHLLEGMARLGHGAVAYVGLDDSAGEAVDLFYKRISHPAMTDIEIDWGGMQVSDVYPREIPDLFVGRPVVLTGRFEGDGLADIRVTGRCGAEEREIALTADLEDESATHAGIPSVWARTLIRHLADRMTYSDDFELPLQIREVAFEYNLMSKYTSFVAVDSKTITAGDHGISLAMPVPVPVGVRYDTTVSE